MTLQVAATDSDLALLNSGTLRSDRIHPPGPFSLRDLHSILPMLDPLIVIEISGKFHHHSHTVKYNDLYGPSGNNKAKIF